MFLLQHSNHGANRKPIIIIDLKEFVHSVVQRDEIGMVLGGRYSMYSKFVRNFLSNIVKSNAELVFFCAGNKVSNDLPLFIPKNESHYIERLKVLDEIEQSNLQAYLKEKHRFNHDKRVSVVFDYNVSKVCHQFGDIHTTYIRHNQEIAQYAKKHADRVLAVISNDTDFLAFDGDYQFWHANSLQLQKLEGRRFNRKLLMEKLDINCHQLQLIGALSGGTFLPWDQVNGFINNLATKSPESVKGKIYNLALYVKRQELASINDTNKVPFKLESVAADIFGPDYTTDQLNAIYNGLMVYDLSFNCDQREKNAFVNFCKANNPFMYFLIAQEVYLVRDVEYIDYRNYKTKNYTQLIVPMIMKLCGILFKDDARRPPRRMICMKYAHDEPAKIVNEHVIYPDSTIVAFLAKSLY